MGTNIQRLLAILARTDSGHGDDSLGNRFDALESSACELFREAFRTLAGKLHTGVLSGCIDQGGNEIAQL